MNGDDVRATCLMRGDAYGARKVDDLLRRIAAELDAGRPAEPLIRNATFPRDRRAFSRYEGNAVDWFLEQFLVSPGQLDGGGMSWDPWRDLPVVNLITRPGLDGPTEQRASVWRGWSLGGRETRRYLTEDCESAWQDFGQLAGTHLRWHGHRRGELRTAREHVIASRRVRTGLLVVTDVLSAGGKNFTVSGEMGPADSSRTRSLRRSQPAATRTARGTSPHPARRARGPAGRGSPD